MSDGDSTGEVTERIAVVLREAQGRDKTHVAAVIRATGLSRSRVYDVFNGKISPSVVELIILCRHFHLDAVRVFSEAVYGRRLD